MIARTSFFAALAVVLLGLNACHTMQGAGRDVERAGDSLEDAARERTPSSSR